MHALTSCEVKLSVLVLTNSDIQSITAGEQNQFLSSYFLEDILSSCIRTKLPYNSLHSRFSHSEGLSNISYIFSFISMEL